MFKHKGHSKKFWIVGVVIVALVTITLILQAQILFMLQDMQTYVLRTIAPITKDYVMDSNPLPPVKPVDKGDYVSDSNPLPPVKPAMESEKVSDSNPLPPVMPELKTEYVK